MQLQERIDASRMSLYQWLIVGLCIVLNALDGSMSWPWPSHPTASPVISTSAAQNLAFCSVPDWSAWPSVPWDWPPSPTLSDGGQ